MTVPRNRAFTIGIDLEYLHPPEGYQLRAVNADIRNTLTIRRQIELKT